MSTLDDITRPVKDLYRKLAAGGKRTAAVTRLRVELAGLDKQRKELYSRLGERVDELRRSGKVIDPGLLGLLEPEFESIDRLRMKIQETMQEIREVNIHSATDEDTSEIISSEQPLMPAEENLLDSFKVL